MWSESYFNAFRAAVSCLVTNVQYQFQHVPALTSSPSFPLEQILISSLQSHPTPHAPAYTFSTFRAARLSSSLYKLFPLLGMPSYPWQTLHSLSQLKSISLKSALADTERCKLSLLYTSCTFCTIALYPVFWFNKFLMQIQTT